MERKYTVDELNGMSRQELREILRPIVKKGQQIPQVDDKGFVKGDQTVSWGIASKNSLIRFIRDKQGEFSLPTVDLPNPYQDVSPRTKGRLDGADTLNDIVEGNFPVEANLPNWGSVDWRDRRSLEEYAISVRSGLESFLEDGVIGTALYDSWREYLDVLDSQIETYGAKINTPEDIRRLERQLDEARDRVSPREGRMFDFGDEVAPQSPTIQDEILRSRKRSADLLTSSVLEDVRQTAEIESGLPPTIQSIREQQQRIAEEQRRVVGSLQGRMMDLMMRQMDKPPTSSTGSLFGLSPEVEITPKSIAENLMTLSQPERATKLIELNTTDRNAVLENMPPVERSRFRSILGQYRVKAEQKGLIGEPSVVVNPVTFKAEKSGPPLTAEDDAFPSEKARQEWVLQQTLAEYSRPPVVFAPPRGGFPFGRPPRPALPTPPIQEPQVETEDIQETKGSGIVRKFYGKGMRRRLRRFR